MLPIKSISPVGLHFRQFVPAENESEIFCWFSLIQSGTNSATIEFIESHTPHVWLKKNIRASIVSALLDSTCEWKIYMAFLDEFLFLNPNIAHLQWYTVNRFDHILIASDASGMLIGIYGMPSNSTDIEKITQALSGLSDILPVAYVDWISLNCTLLEKGKNAGNTPEKTDWQERTFRPKNPYTSRFAYFLVIPMIALAGHFSKYVNPGVILIFLFPLWFIIPLFIRVAWAWANVRTRYVFRKTEVLRRSLFGEKKYPFDIIDAVVISGSELYIRSIDDSVLKSSTHSIENYECADDIASEWMKGLMRSELKFTPDNAVRKKYERSILDIWKTRNQSGSALFDDFIRAIFPSSISKLWTFMSVHYGSARSILTRKRIFTLEMLGKDSWTRVYPDFSNLAGIELTYVGSMNHTSIFMSKDGIVYTSICGRLCVHEWTFETGIDSVIFGNTAREIPLLPTSVNVYRHAWHNWLPMNYETGIYEGAKDILSQSAAYSDNMTFPLFDQESNHNFIAYSKSKKKYLKCSTRTGEDWNQPIIEDLSESTIKTAASSDYVSFSVFLNTTQAKKYISDCLSILRMQRDDFFTDMNRAFEKMESTFRISDDSGETFLTVETVNRDWYNIWSQYDSWLDGLVRKAQTAALQGETRSQEIARWNLREFSSICKSDYREPPRGLTPIFPYIRDDSIEVRPDKFAQYSIAVPETHIHFFMADITSILGIEMDFLYLQDMLVNDGVPWMSYLTIFKDELQRVKGFIAADLQRHDTPTDYPTTIRCEKNMAQKIKGRLEEWDGIFHPNRTSSMIDQFDKTDTNLDQAMKKYRLTLRDIYSNNSEKQRDERYWWKQKLRRMVREWCK